jgi:selenide, water dikinase
VIAPDPRHCYSGMVPGYLRGTYRLDEIAVDLAPLVSAAGGHLLLGTALRLDPGRRVVEVEVEPAGTATRPTQEVPYDLVSFAVGSDAKGAAEAAARGGAAVLSCKPIGRAVELRRRLEEMAGRRREPEPVVVVGGGAAGVELALAIAGRFRAAAAPHPVTLVEAGPCILASDSPRTRRRAAAVLARRQVALLTGSAVAAVEAAEETEQAEGEGAEAERADRPAARVRLDNGESLPCRLVVWVTAAVGWPIFRDSGLPLDDRGFLLIDEDLRSIGDPRVFAAGDCGTLARFPKTPKAGVYAVREGPVLHGSLLAALAGDKPPHYRPQQGFLAILNTGDDRALLTYKGLVSYSRWALRLKDRIDRRFLARYRG